MIRLAGPLAMLVAACASEAGVEPTAQEFDDVAMSVASTLRPVGGGGELGAMLDVTAIARGGMPAGFAADTSGRVRGDHLGLTYHYDLACRDAHNRVLAACGSQTDNAEVAVAWGGLLVLPYLETTVERDGTWILNDITPELLRLDGDGQLTYEHRITGRDGVVATYRFSYDASHRAIMLAPGDRWPRSGTVRYDVRAWRSREPEPTSDARELALDVELRFVASGSATIRFDATHAYTLNLATGTIRRGD